MKGCPTNVGCPCTHYSRYTWQCNATQNQNYANSFNYLRWMILKLTYMVQRVITTYLHLPITPVAYFLSSFYIICGGIGRIQTISSLSCEWICFVTRLAFVKKMHCPNGMLLRVESCWHHTRGLTNFSFLLNFMIVTKQIQTQLQIFQRLNVVRLQLWR